MCSSMGATFGYYTYHYYQVLLQYYYNNTTTNTILYKSRYRSFSVTRQLYIYKTQYGYMCVNLVLHGSAGTGRIIMEIMHMQDW